MKKKILLPTDFSKNAWNALCYASELYKNEEVEFYLLHAFMVQNYTMDNLMVPEPGENHFEEVKSRSEHNIQKLLKQIKILDVPGNHKYFIESVFNTPLEAVKALVEDKDIDMVIVGHKGETDAIDVLIGSNSIDFMEKIRNCPVLMIPSETSFKEPNEIVFPTSFKTHYKHKELFHLYEIAKITNAPIRILHISEEKELSEEQKVKKALLEEIFDGLIYTFNFLKNTQVQMGVNIFMQSRNSDMVAFINKKHDFLETLFSKPMVKNLGYSAKVPVLSLHDLRN